MQALLRGAPPTSQVPTAAFAAAAPPAADDEDDPFADISTDDLPSDVEAAMGLLKSRFLWSPGCADLPPLVLQSQLYSVLRDRTEVDRQLDDLRRRNVVRVFKLSSGGAPGGGGPS